ncbi:MAG: hypothetical protein CMJ49_10905 [Planctomycetaceae bacterium]|nr:hypothetical protein [Planctomycetaceae bacterium]
MNQTTMKALAVTELSRRAELIDRPIPRIADDQVLIRVHYSGVSIGTEMWNAHGRRKDYGDVPFVNGYQVTGEIESLGNNVDGFNVGDLVACFVSGAHAQYAVGRTEYLHKLADPAIAKTASLFVPPAVAANGLNMTGLNCGDAVLIIGQGLIGQAAAQLCRLRGAHVLASDIQPDRLELSRQYCADDVIDARSAPTCEQLKQRDIGRIDMVIESTGFEPLIDEAMQCCSPGSKLMFLGFAPDKPAFTYAVPHTKQIQAYFPCFIGSHASRQGVFRLLAAGKLDIDPL